MARRTAGVLTRGRRRAGLDRRPRRAENRRVIRPRLLALIALRLAIGLLGAACRGPARDPGPPCSAVAARFLDIARTDLDRAVRDGASAATRRAVEDQLPAMRDSLTQACA